MLYCAFAALAYTAVNICMRRLTALRCDTALAVFSREFVTTVLVGIWLLGQALRGRSTLPRGRTLGQLLLVGFFVQLIGNTCLQWAMGIVGLAVSIPAFYGTVITTGALLGQVWLGERVSPRSIAAIMLLMIALVLLGLGAETTGKSIAPQDALPPTTSVLILAVAGAGLAGVISGLLTITIRHSVIQATLPMAIAFLVPMTGAITLGPVSLYRLGLPALWNTPGEQIALMVAAGTFNLLGFLAIIHGLQRTTVLYANAVNASQVAMAAVAGMMLFHEPPNPWLLLGVFLTIGGILGFDRPTENTEL